jgi:GAF domain-containing protein
MTELEQLAIALDDKSASRQALLETICRSAAKLIPNANLISLWVFEGNATKIRSLIHFDVENNGFSADTILCKEDFPPYFEAIIEEQVVVASDARNTRATACFTESYFQPNDIHSLLDFILHKDFKPVGVVCCESQGTMVQWSESDIDMISALATMISFFFDV